MTALADIPRVHPARPANDPRPPLSAEDRRALIETESLANSLEDLDRARRRDRTVIADVDRLTAAPVHDVIDVVPLESDSFEYRVMSGLAAFIGAAAVILVATFALSLLADLPSVLARGMAP
ncbi:hypothetical protein T8T21_08615 [Limimaricola variabilis]|uniref:hypothetical protein n=1 Tax=Limimaricola variabilis TaxID=1492771 RepID=UPI002AC9ED4F|nr:hypothetical protein [Limimaricola variabilis]WPY93189.1 hypothetical protein T8T21_08615 [Limimaricola variabilis]